MPKSAEEQPPLCQGRSRMGRLAQVVTAICRNFSVAESTTTLPVVEMQNSRSCAQTGEPKNRPSTRSCQTISPLLPAHASDDAGVAPEKQQPALGQARRHVRDRPAQLVRQTRRRPLGHVARLKGHEIVATAAAAARANEQAVATRQELTVRLSNRSTCSHNVLPVLGFTNVMPLAMLLNNNPLAPEGPTNGTGSQRTPWNWRVAAAKVACRCRHPAQPESSVRPRQIER